MKKIILLLFALVSTVVVVHAQTYTKPLISANAAALIPTVDTVTNTGSKLMTLQIGLSPNIPRRNVTISAVATLISGTGAGTVILQGSIDGINYSTIPAAFLLGAETATFTLTNVASQAYHFVVVGNPFVFYRINLTGSGTEVISIAGNVLPQLSN